MSIETRGYSPEKIYEVVVAFNGEKNYFNLLNVILEKMMDMTNADGGTLYILEDDMLHFRILRNKTLNTFRSAFETIDLPPIKLDANSIANISAYSAIKNEIVTIEDVYASDKFNFTGPKDYDKLTGYRTQSMLVIPLTTVQNDVHTVIGVIQLINAVNAETGAVEPFCDVYDPPILPAIANIAASTLANLLYGEEIKLMFSSFVKVMSKAIDERSPYNHNHTNNVAKYCEVFGKYLGEQFPPEHELYFDDARTEKLVMAAFLHDIGKIITPLNVMDKPDRLGDQLEIVLYRLQIKRHQIQLAHLRGETDEAAYIAELDALDEARALVESSNAAGFLPNDTLDKIRALADMTYIDGENVVPVFTPLNMDALLVQKGTLTEAERLIMQEHVSVTGRLLDEMTFNKYYADVPGWARGHHEFLDGSGYPDGKKGGEVPVEVRILTIMDVYDALTANDRPYKKAMPEDRAFKVLDEMVGEGKLHGELTRLFTESGVWRKDGQS